MCESISIAKFGAIKSLIVDVNMQIGDFNLYDELSFIGVRGANRVFVCGVTDHQVLSFKEV